MTENIETIKLRNEIRTLEILTTLFILIGQFPEKPKCVKYLLDKYGIFKWFIVIIFLYNKNFPLKILITILIVYNFFYICDEIYFKNDYIENDNIEKKYNKCYIINNK